MSHPPNERYPDYRHRPDGPYGQPGYDGEADDGGPGRYPSTSRHEATYGDRRQPGSYGQPAGRSYPSQRDGQSYDPYGEPHEQSYPGYEPDPSYGSYGQPREHTGYEPSYGTYGQPREQAYPGYGPDESYGAYGPPADQGYPGYGHEARQPRREASGASYADYRHGSDPIPSGYGEPVPPPGKKVGKIVLLSVVAALVLCGGGGATAFFLLKDDVKGVAEASKTRLVTPETLAGRPKIKDGALQGLADKLVNDMKRDVPQATSWVGAFYGTPAKKDMIMIAGASGPVSDPGKQLNQAIQAMGAGGLKIRNATAVQPGPLGGVAKCGDATADGVPMGVCAWSDRGSLGMLVLYFKNAKQASAEFVAIRGAIQQRV